MAVLIKYLYSLFLLLFLHLSHDVLLRYAWAVMLQGVPPAVKILPFFPSVFSLLYSRGSLLFIETKFLLSQDQFTLFDAVQVAEGLKDLH